MTENPAKVLVSIAFIKRKPGMSREEFYHHWANIHGPLVKPWAKKHGFISYKQVQRSFVLSSHCSSSSPSRPVFYLSPSFRNFHKLPSSRFQLPGSPSFIPFAFRPPFHITLRSYQLLMLLTFPSQVPHNTGAKCRRPGYRARKRRSGRPGRVGRLCRVRGPKL
jgi:hypothetical protein